MNPERFAVLKLSFDEEIVEIIVRPLIDMGQSGLRHQVVSSNGIFKIPRWPFVAQKKFRHERVIAFLQTWVTFEVRRRFTIRDRSSWLLTMVALQASLPPPKMSPMRF